MAAQTSVEILISARDRFSPVFQQLDEALGQAGRASGGMEQALSGLDSALNGITRGTDEASQATADFANRAGESLTAFSALRLELEQQGNALSEEVALGHGERMLAIEQELHQNLNSVVEEGLQQRSSLWQAFFQSVMNAMTDFTNQLFATDKVSFQARLAQYQTFVEKWIELTEHQGGSIVRFNKALAISSALIDAYRAANSALANVPFPLNFAAAALVLAEGLQNVQRIRQVSVAHGGLEEVPEDSTFLLRRGERVLAPRQNEDLTEFLRAERAGAARGVVIERLDIHVLENATAGAALLAMGTAEWRQIVAERIIPALNELAELGIRPAIPVSAS